jgi:hypothetical protein
MTDVRIRDTKYRVTIARPVIAAGQSQRKPNRLFILQMAFRETIAVLKEALLDLTLGRFTHLGVRHRDHERYYPGAGRSVTPIRVGIFGGHMLRLGREVFAMQSRNRTTMNPVCSGDRRRNFGYI